MKGLVILLFSLALASCQRERLIRPDEFRQQKNVHCTNEEHTDRVVRVQTKSDSTILFVGTTGVYLPTYDAIFGTMENGRDTSLALESVARLYVEGSGRAGTILGIALLAVLYFAIQVWIVGNVRIY